MPNELTTFAYDIEMRFELNASVAKVKKNTGNRMHAIANALLTSARTHALEMEIKWIRMQYSIYTV